MNGAILHEHMVGQLDSDFQDHGLWTGRQVPARAGRIIGYVDLVVGDGCGRFHCVEVEMSSKRIENDCHKAIALNASLWIVAPHLRLRETIQKRLGELSVVSDQQIIAVTYHQARKLVANKISFYSWPKLGEKENKTPKRTF